eukprot:gene8326-150_t
MGNQLDGEYGVNEENYEKIQKMIEERSSPDGTIMNLNVGGKKFTTLKSTLLKSKFFEDLFNNDKIIYDKDDNIFIDRPSKEFSIILDSLRTDQMEAPEEQHEFANLVFELKFYQLDKLFKDVVLAGRFFGTTVLNSSQQKQLNAWVNNKTKDWKLLYKASKDGYQCKNFHSKCDGESNTITIITSGKYIFGGYTPARWSKNGNYTFNNGTFLFSLVNPSNVAPCQFPNNGLYHSNTYSIYSKNNYGPTFGGGHDLYISNNCNTNSQSYSNLGHSFQAPSGTTYGSL